MLLVSPFRLYRQHKAQIARLRYPMSISFENTDEYIDRDREGYGDDVVPLKLTVTRQMMGVCCQVKSVRRKNDDGWSKPLNGRTQFSLGMPYGNSSWDSRNVADQEWIILFHHKEGRLSIFTDIDYLEFRGWKDDLPIGEYRFELVLSASNLEQPIRKNLYITWTGKIDDLSITISDV